MSRFWSWIIALGVVTLCQNIANAANNCADAGTIGMDGPEYILAGSTENTYSVTGVAGSGTYRWSYNSDFDLESGGGNSSSITLTAPSTPSSYPENMTVTCFYTDSRGTCEVGIEVTVIWVGVAMDGNRNDLIELSNSEDSEYLFWVNGDFDNEHRNEFMWQQDDQDGNGDADDDYIGNSTKLGVKGCARDLEDFARIHLFVDDNATSLPGISYHLKFENVTTTSSSPSVNLFEAVETSSRYLSNTNVAAAQILKERIHDGDVKTIGSTEFELDASYIKSGNERSPFLLEGKTRGTGDLSFIVKINEEEVCRKSIHLELHDINWFYNVFRAEVTSGDRWEVMVKDISTLENEAYYSPATNEQFLLVHGWNMTELAKQQWVETTFKRLWWQGYQGNVNLFSWPTLAEFGGFWDVVTDSRHFNNSEMRSWMSANALIDVFNSLNSDGELCVMAHSMGNVVTGEAIRRYTGSHKISTYIAAQAALSAHYYDHDVAIVFPVNRKIAGVTMPLTTPDVFGHYKTGAASLDPYFKDNDSKVLRMINYYNEYDWALDKWEMNNILKPTNVSPYYFEYSDCSKRFYRGINGNYDYLDLDDNGERYQVFSYCAESVSKALGQAGLNLEFSLHRDLNDLFRYDGEHYSHSKEFRSNLPEEWEFWVKIVKDCKFTTTLTE